MKKRLLAIFMTVVSAVLLLTACGGNGQDSKKQQKTVVVGVYGGDWEKNIKPILQKFEKDTGIKVQTVSGADSEWFTKLKASNGKNPPYDLLILQPDTIQRGIAANVIEPINEEKAPNVKNLYSSVQKKLTVDGKQYAAGFSMGQLGIAYRKDLIKQEPNSWTDLWSKQLKGKVAISSPTYSAGLQFFSALVHAQGGTESNPKDIEKAFKSLAQLKGQVAAFPDNSGSIQTLLERGDVLAVPYWDGRVFALEEEGLDIGFAYPKEGAVAAVASWTLTKGSEHQDTAYELLNYLSGKEAQEAFSEKSYYGMSNSDVKYNDKIKGKVKVGENYYSKLTWVDYETAASELGSWTNRWNEVLGGGN
ncbi:ABC transporter substrate-binding protein [Bacillus sp. NPDC077027]|uniref:ABC transporter substrate-binding protein n=1 Tax=Bacillus sp. NPDC077027 TaxID=3390548 RepID=UPI003D0820E8